MFGYGYVKKWELEVEYLQEFVQKLLEENEKLANKAVRLEIALKNRDTQVVALEQELKAKKKYKKRRKELSHRTGFTKVTEEERKKMYSLYQEGIDVHKIAAHLSRSHTCVSSHIRKQLEEDSNEAKQMGSLHRPKVGNTKKEK